jgi:hypothetical protein
MHLIRVGNKIVNLEAVQVVNLDAKGGYDPKSAKYSDSSVAMIFPYADAEFFGEEAEQLRAFFGALSTTEPTDYPYEVLDLAGVVADAEAKQKAMPRRSTEPTPAADRWPSDRGFDLAASNMEGDR